MIEQSTAVISQPMPAIQVLRNLLQISRLTGWLLGFTCIRAGMILGGARMSDEAVMLLFFGTFPFSFWLFAWNDLSDRDSDRINPRKPSWIHGGLITDYLEKPVRRILACLILVPIAGAFIWPLRTTILVLVVYALCFAYSVKPIRLKEVPFLDAYCSAGIIWSLFAAGFSLGGSLSRLPIETYFFLPTILGIQFFSTVTDIDCDAKVGYWTMATRFGKRATYFIAMFFVFLSLVTIPFVHYARIVEVVIVVHFVVFAACWLFPERMPYKACYLGLTAVSFIAGVLFIFS